MASIAAAQEQVTIATGTDNAARRILSGTITDYNGKELKINVVGAQAMTVPASRVVQVQATWSARHAEGDRLLEQHKFAEAIEAYRLATAEETRGWAKRRIFAQVVTSYEALGQYERAGDAYVLVIKSDEHWQFFERIPLAWTSGLTDATLAQKAKAWLAAADSPPLVLLGASWSLSGEERATAVAALRTLSDSTDPRIAHLADAQLWRANVATVGPQELQAWEAQIERMPAKLRSGPYLVLGKGWLQQNARMLGDADSVHRRAAWAFLKSPLLAPERPAHAMEGLLLAADPLAKLQWDDEATIVLREVAARYAATEAGRAAAERLQRQPTAKPR